MAGRVAIAIVHEEPPRVFMAEDQDTLNWVLALHLVAAEPGERLAPDLRETLRSALLEERWADAVVAWIGHHDLPVDIYSSETLFESADVELASAELQFSPLFRD